MRWLNPALGDCLRPGVGDREVGALAWSRYLTGLETLDLEDAGLTADGARRFASAGAPNLQVLNLSGNPIGGDGLMSLVTSRSLPRLSRLSLAGGGLSQEATEAVAREPRLTRFVALDLSSNRLDSRACGALARSPYVAGLRRLSLTWNELTANGAKLLAASAHLSGLADLDFFVNELGPDGAAALARSRYLRLRKLSLHHNGLGPQEPNGSRRASGMGSATSTWAPTALATRVLPRWRSRPSWRGSGGCASTTTTSPQPARGPWRIPRTWGTSSSWT